MKENLSDDRTRMVEELKSNLELSYLGLYNKSKENLLARLCDKYGSDKGSLRNKNHAYPWPAHTYSDLYFRLFNHCRFDVKKVFECGLGTNNVNLASNMGKNGRPGASLRVWRDYFPKARVYGADIDSDILFKEKRIDTFQVDQTDPKSIRKLWKEVGVNNFDILIDDGLHTFEAGVCLFENSKSKFSKNGIYIIEDVNGPDMLKFQKYFSKKDLVVDYIGLFSPQSVVNDNNLVVIRNL